MWRRHPVAHVSLDTWTVTHDMYGGCSGRERNTSVESRARREVGNLDMVANTNVLPPEYDSRMAVDLKDRKVAAAIQLVFVVVAVVMVGGALLLDFPMSSGNPWVTISVAVVSCVVYMAVHELTHAVLLWAFSRVRPTVALRIPYLAVGGRGYLNRRSFVIVALAPVVLWGIVLVTLLFALPSQFFLPVYVVTVLNFAGSSGDYFQAYAVARLPGNALIQDDGKTTTVYLPAGA